jgi:hypothetical protein
MHALEDEALVDFVFVALSLYIPNLKKWTRKVWGILPRL